MGSHRSAAHVDDQPSHAPEQAPFGRWLVLPDAASRSERDGRDAGPSYGVALTAGGRIAVYLLAGRSSPVVSEYDTLDEIPTCDLPDNVRELAARQLGETFVVLLDR